MGRLTEVMHFFNSAKTPTVGWIKQNYSHFRPTVDDQKMRKEYVKRDTKHKKKRRKVMKDIFG